MINGFVVVEDNTQLELTQGNVTTRFIPLGEPLEIQSEDPELLWTLHLINVDDSQDGRAYTLDEEEKESISAFLLNYNLI